MFILNDKLIFPPTNQAHDDGLLCIGGDLSSERLILAYSQGIFPWFNEDDPILWYSPNPRFILFPSKLKISKSMKQIMNREEYSWTMNQEFTNVIQHCRVQKRNGQDGTWITNEMEAAYIKLHQLGYAHSFECWHEKQLVGGLYGVRINRMFCGESMFSLKPNASKFALIKMIEYLSTQQVELIDCQVHTSHLESLGAEMIPRREFESYLH